MIEIHSSEPNVNLLFLGFYNLFNFYMEVCGHILSVTIQVKPLWH